MSSPTDTTTEIPSDTPGTSPEPQDEDKLYRIKQLVSKSRLYTAFLTESLNNGDKKVSVLEKECNLAVKLHKHQEQAVEWLLELYRNGLNGILADEMGLGKTLETIAFLSYLTSQGTTGPFLIIAPLSTLGNWCREINSFAPHLNVLKFYGNASERMALSRKLKSAKLVVTSYEMILNDANSLRSTPWKYIIVDEGHRIKNVNCKLVKELKKLSSANRMLLTGTPLQNNLMELWALLSFLMPDVFTDIDIFHSWFEQGIKIDHESEGDLVTSLHSILRPFVLRRLKSEVDLGLPPKREYVVYCGLTKLQKDLYQHLLDGDIKEYVLGLYKDTLGGRNKRLKLSETRRKDIESQERKIELSLKRRTFNNLVMQMRQVCNSPFLIYSTWTPDTKVTSEIETTSEKLIMLWKFIDKLQKTNHKTLLFSQFTGMLDVVEDWAEYRKVSTCRIDGSSSQQDREEMMKSFRDGDANLFLLSTRSGGQGINLTTADTVIILDSDWNPHQDLQAMDRVHRIGQTKPVLVFRFVCGNTVEHTMLDRAYAKLDFGNTIIESANLKGLGASQEESIQQLKNQFRDYEATYSEGITLTDSDFDKMLDRSPEAYANPEVPNPNVYAVKLD